MFILYYTFTDSLNVYFVQALRFFMSSNLTVQGLKIKNSPFFHFRFDSCHDVHIDSLYIKSPSLSPNTDGIHIENTNDVTIQNSIIYNGKVLNSWTISYPTPLECHPSPTLRKHRYFVHRATFSFLTHSFSLMVLLVLFLSTCLISCR